MAVVFTSYFQQTQVRYWAGSSKIIAQDVLPIANCVNFVDLTTTVYFEERDKS